MFAFCTFTTQIVNIYFQKKQGNQLLLQKVVRYSLISETSKELGFLNQIEWQNLGFFQSSQCIPFCNIKKKLDRVAKSRGLH
jgi:hypothetical protein